MEIAVMLSVLVEALYAPSRDHGAQTLPPF
jgi:hypothetical protein